MILMGTYYALNVVNNFKAKPTKSLTAHEMEKAVNERLNLELFDVTFANDCLQGNLKPDLFKDNIEDFFNKLYLITNRSTRASYYFQKFGNDIDQYPCEFERWSICDSEGNEINLQGNLVSLFLEGKVGAEEFDIEPALINWLFRHINFGNPLAGAIMSSIVG
jgi:glutamine cyclotransferase